jgi:peptide/nickel transport system substrate-binding protein
MRSATNSVCALAAGLAILAASPAAFAAKSDDTIRFSSVETLEHADPYFNAQVIGSVVADHVWDSLLYRNETTGEYVGNLATAWRQIDERTFEFDLRQGVRFHNGEAFDADDVVYTLNFVVDPANSIAALSRVRWIERADKIERFKVRVVTRSPFPAAIEYFASAMLAIHPNEYHAAVGPQGTNRRPIGTGPYRVTEHAPGKHLRMTRNDAYFRDGPKTPARVANVELRFIPDVQTRVAEVVAGGLDLITGVGRDQADQLRDERDLQVLEGESLIYNFLQLNTRPDSPAPQLQDLRVRRAILHAIDREALVKYLVGQPARVLHVPCHPRHFGCDDTNVARYDYDPEKARRLLAEAGYPNGFAVDLYAFYQRNETDSIVSYLQAVGIDARLRFVQSAAARTAARSNRVALYNNVWATVIADAANSVSTFFGGLPDDLNRDSEVIAWVARGDATLDAAERTAAYNQALRLIAERAYVLPLFTTPMYYVGGRDLRFTPSADGRPRFYEMEWR